MNAIVLLLAVALLLCFVFVWDAQTHRLMNRAIVQTYTEDAPRTDDGYLWDEFDGTPTEYVDALNLAIIGAPIRIRHKNRRALANVVTEDAEFDTPVRIKKTRKMYAFQTSHSGKGATLHTYRVKGFTKNVLHPCK